MGLGLSAFLFYSLLLEKCKFYAIMIKAIGVGELYFE